MLGKALLVPLGHDRKWLAACQAFSQCRGLLLQNVIVSVGAAQFGRDDAEPALAIEKAKLENPVCLLCLFEKNNRFDAWDLTFEYLVDIGKVADKKIRPISA
jgi:hypothetical protein